MTGPPICPASRGDLAVLINTVNDLVPGSGYVERTAVELALVTSVTRTGLVKVVQNHYGTPVELDYLKRVYRTRVLMIPKHRIDVQGALRTAREHCYPGHPDQPRPFNSEDEIRQALRHHLLTD